MSYKTDIQKIDLALRAYESARFRVTKHTKSAVADLLRKSGNADRICIDIPMGHQWSAYTKSGAVFPVSRIQFQGDILCISGGKGAGFQLCIISELDPETLPGFVASLKAHLNVDEK